ncbi:EthD domain-containing protein [Pyrenochaeta sp. MPI-SDFR-AT-0127]|nr:EthD domain-containing protein [Pyrenochaeta sp. MPI-SDFR-AT-0127]
MAETAEKYCIQIVTYIRRRRDLTQEQFYDHWKNVHAPKVVPWAEKHGISRYQQVYVSGSMVPIAATASAPNAISKDNLPTTPVEFDGIAMFLVPSLKQFTDAFKDPYYTEVIEPDEREMLDKDGPGSGVIASFQGPMIDMVHQGQNTLGQRGLIYREIFGEFEKGRAL